MKFWMLAAVAAVATGTAFGKDAGPASRPATTQAVRKAADGAPLPPVQAGGDSSGPQLPIIGDILGKSPEQAFPRGVLSVRRSGKAAKDKLGQAVEGEWFVLSKANPQIISFTLAGGRISKATAYLFGMDDHQKVVALREKVNESPKGVTASVEFVKEGKGGPVYRASFALDPVEGYLAAHNEPKAMADALRGRRWVEGMTEDQQRLANDGPGTYFVELGDAADLLDGGDAGVVDSAAQIPAASDTITLTVWAPSRHDAARKAMEGRSPKRWRVIDATIKTPGKPEATPRG